MGGGVKCQQQEKSQERVHTTALIVAKRLLLTMIQTHYHLAPSATALSSTRSRKEYSGLVASQESRGWGVVRTTCSASANTLFVRGSSGYAPAWVDEPPDWGVPKSDHVADAGVPVRRMLSAVIRLVTRLHGRRRERRAGCLQNWRPRRNRLGLA